jgi:hypothetical protein
MIRLCLCYDCLHLWMLVFDYMIRLHDYVIWFCYMIHLFYMISYKMSQSMKDKVADIMADRLNECWWGQWRRLTLGHESEYEIVQGLWSSCLAKGVTNLVGIWWVNQKWKGWTLQKLYSSIRLISGRAEAEGEEASYEDHISCWRRYKSKLVKIWRNQDTPFATNKDLSEEDWSRFVTKCESENLAVNSEYMQWLRSQNELDHHLSNTSYARK